MSVEKSFTYDFGLFKVSVTFSITDASEEIKKAFEEFIKRDNVIDWDFVYIIIDLVKNICKGVDEHLYGDIYPIEKGDIVSITTSLDILSKITQKCLEVKKTT